MSGFDGPPLVAGSINGFRHFNVNKGRLESPVQGTEWHPGENVAYCYMAGQSWMGFGRHRAGGGGYEHMCGFYAYHQPWFSTYGGPGTVHAVIEAYGTVSVGPRGFRAEKAKVVAVVAPRRPRFAGVRPASVVFVAWVVFALTQSYFMPDFSPWLLLPLGAITGVFVGRLARAGDAPRDLRRRLMENYPDVKVYSTTFTMWLAYRERTSARLPI